MSRRAGSKQVRALLPPGYTLVDGRKHLGVIGPGGEVVRRSNGRPLVLPKGAKLNERSVRLIMKNL